MRVRMSVARCCCEVPYTCYLPDGFTGAADAGFSHDFSTTDPAVDLTPISGAGTVGFLQNDRCEFDTTSASPPVPPPSSALRLKYTLPEQIGTSRTITVDYDFGFDNVVPFVYSGQTMWVDQYVWFGLNGTALLQSVIFNVGGGEPGNPPRPTRVTGSFTHKVTRIADGIGGSNTRRSEIRDASDTLIHTMDINEDAQGYPCFTEVLAGVTTGSTTQGPLIGAYGYNGIVGGFDNLAIS